MEEFGQQQSASLSLTDDGHWQFSLRVGDETLTALEGESIAYTHRQKRNPQDWLQFPVIGITHQMAMAYVQWLNETGEVPNARLCTELEWERAARGADHRLYSHGDVLSTDDANYAASHSAFGLDEVGTHPISQSPFGVHDMVGNAWEWTVSVLEDGFVLRGGSYTAGAIEARTTKRTTLPLSRGYSDVGFRICADIIE